MTKHFPETVDGARQASIGASASASMPDERTLTFAFQVLGWKQPIFERNFPDRNFVFVPTHLGARDVEREWMEPIAAAKGAEIFVWSLHLPDGVRQLAMERGMPVYFIEDGFIRSVQPNASRSAPLSLALDRSTAYFDSRTASDLEDLLRTYDFDADPALLSRAANGIRFLLETGVSKYNSGTQIDIAALYGPKTRRRILVIGQVETDASIEFGCARPVTNNDLVRLAASENPDADILYKPHPDILNRVRTAQSNPGDVKHLCRILSEPLSMAQAFETIDHVYTITSLAGFEALLRGIKVTAYGCPFYAGWGLTDDRQPNPRRGRVLSVAALFAGAYLLYPRYFHPVTGEAASFEATVERIRQYFLDGGTDPSQMGGPKVRPRWKPFGAYGILGWRHLLTPVLSLFIGRIGNANDVRHYRENPVLFFRELSDPRFRRIGRIFYPRDG